MSNVRHLQRTLYLKSKQEKDARFHSLYDKIYRDDVFQEAWRQVKANRGAPGVDGESIDEIVAQGREQEMIDGLTAALRGHSYRFSPVRGVEIPKPKGGTRTLGIPTVEDRVVHTAMKIVLEPIFEADFHDCSYAYRPKRSAVDASVAIREDLYDRAWGVVEIDFQAYFDSIPHDKLLTLIAGRVADGSVLKLIKQTLKVGMLHEGQVMPMDVGVPQGSPISPLYSNIYLNVIDQAWHRWGYPQRLGATLHRYADDAILVCRRSAKSAREAFESLARRLELTVNPEKTRVTRLTEGFVFVGYQFVKRRSPNSGKPTIYLFPSKDSQQRIRNRLKYLTSRRAPLKPEEFTAMVNPIVLGWVNPFRHTNASDAFRRLQVFINTRFRRYLTSRSKGRGFGWKRYPNSKLYSMGIIYIGSGKLKYIRSPVHGSRRRLSDRRIREH